MNLKEFFEANRKVKFPKVPKGSAVTVEGFFNECMRKVKIMPSAKAIIGWHRLLCNYMEKDGNRLLLRLYEGVKIDNVLETRRGAVTRMHDGFEYVFASNYFARVIYTMAFMGYVPDDSDFEDMIKNRKVCVSYPRHVNPGEQEISAYTSRMSMAEYSTSGFYTPGWYLAHIVSVNDVLFKGFSDVKVKHFISPGVRSDWSYEQGVPVRRMETYLNSDERKMLKAHFLRFLDPINYFLVPSSSLEAHKFGRKIIGEDPDVVAYAQSAMRSMVNEDEAGVYEDFCERALVPDQSADMSREDSAHKRICIEFSPSPVERTDNLDHGKTKAKGIAAKERASNRGLKKWEMTLDENMLISVLRAYLIEGKSFRLIESEVLRMGLKKRGGGFKAKQILNGLGVGADAKGILSTSEAESYMANCGDLLHSLLQKLRVC